ncbi:PREDICTED: uncharacterized protein LOC106107964 isoform X2 [Papilio polytes]|uniref:uncharacterized protein LOC106107964 isoform X2 n=1 Tax=Papilio polytes TaxID=76194 RepID=UPI00067698C0|nr:PREDICTED: uncharacterized protein LOC106107964 isoform X2 [Papilio polytes]
MPVSTRTLVKIAGWGGLVLSVTGFYLDGKLVDRFRNYDYYKEAMKEIRNHRGAVHYLGEPIKDGISRVSHIKFTNNEPISGEYCIPIRGPKGKVCAMNTQNMNPRFIGTPKEKYSFFNTLLCLVKSLQGQNITVDLRNDSYVCGLLLTVDGYMNLSFTTAVYCDPQGSEFFFENIFVHSRNIRYVHIPENVSIINNIKNEVSKEIRNKPKGPPTDKSRKAKKAYNQHMQTVATFYKR